MALTLQPLGKPSSNVKEVGYDAEENILAIRFGNGALYHYKNVPADVHADLLEADSAGSFIAKNVRGKFETVPIDETKKEESGEGADR